MTFADEARYRFVSLLASRFSRGREIVWTGVELNRQAEEDFEDVGMPDRT